MMRQIEEKTADLQERIDTLEDAYERLTKENKALRDEIRKNKNKTSSKKKKEKPPTIVSVSPFHFSNTYYTFFPMFFSVLKGFKTLRDC